MAKVVWMNVNVTPFELNAFKCEKVKGISCGAYHSITLMKSGQVYSWGKNDNGQLGIGNTKTTQYPKLVKLSKTVDFEKIVLSSKLVTQSWSH